MTEHLKFSIEDGIAKIVLDRPERMNAFTFEMIDAWTRSRTSANGSSPVPWPLLRFLVASAIRWLSSMI